MSILIDLVREDFGISGKGKWWRSDIHSSLVVDSENDLYYFNSRNLRGDAKHYLINVRGLSRQNAELFVRALESRLQLPELKETSLQTKFEKLVNLFHNNGKTNRDYWYKKGLDDRTIDRYRLGFLDGWYTIPIYDSSKFVNFQCRRDDPKRIKFWYKDDDFKPILYNSDILKFVNTVYIVEGMVDCLLLNQNGIPSVCSTNGAMGWNQNWIKDFTKVSEIFYIADNDKAGVEGAKRVANSLGTSRVKVFRFKDKSSKYGAANFFLEGGTPDEFISTVSSQFVFGFEGDSI